MAKPREYYTLILADLKRCGISVIEIDSKDYRVWQQNLGHALRDRGLRCSIERLTETHAAVKLMPNAEVQLLREKAERELQGLTETVHSLIAALERAGATITPRPR